jgi:hypothetical protein
MYLPASFPKKRMNPHVRRTLWIPAQGQPMIFAGSQCINMPTRKSISYKGWNKMDIYDLIAAK